jgi:hypothetical protein
MDAAMQAMHLVFSKTFSANPGKEVFSVGTFLPEPRLENFLLPFLLLVVLEGKSFSSELLISKLVSICCCLYEARSSGFPKDEMLLLLLFFLLPFAFLLLFPSEAFDLPRTCELGFSLSASPLFGVLSTSPEADRPIWQYRAGAIPNFRRRRGEAAWPRGRREAAAGG